MFPLRPHHHDLRTVVLGKNYSPLINSHGVCWMLYVEVACVFLVKLLVLARFFRVTVIYLFVCFPRWERIGFCLPRVLHSRLRFFSSRSALSFVYGCDSIATRVKNPSAIIDYKVLSRCSPE